MIRNYIILLFFVSVTGQIINAEIIDRIAAVVGDEIILKSEVDQFVAHQKYANGNISDDLELREAVLNELISAKVIYETALKDSTITVSDEEVQRMLDNRINSVIDQVGGEKKFEEMYNTSVSDLKKQYRSDIRKNLFAEKLKNKHMQKISVNRKEIEKFYSDYKDSLPPVKSSVSLSQMVIGFSNQSMQETKSIEILQDLKKKIVAGEIDFESAAEKYSQDETTSKKGGSIGTTKRGDLVPEYERAAYNLEKGDISDPVKTAFGYHLIKLNEKTGEKINSSHILITPDKSIENDSTAMKFAQTIKDSVVGKYMTFEEAVKKYSNDQKTKYSDGIIGSLKIEDLEKKYRDIFENEQAGYISDPIKEKDGYYVYKITDRQSAHKIDIASDYNMLKNLALDKKRQFEMKKWIEDIKKKVYIEVK